MNYQKQRAKKRIVNQLENWFFDLDNTLYRKPDLFKLIDKRISLFVMNFLNLDNNRAEALRKSYFYQYGTTLRGLIDNFSIDPVNYLNYVHDIEIHKFLKSDFSLKLSLENIKGRKFIFTNASKGHAEAVLDSLGIKECFEEIFDTGHFCYHAKPESVTFEKIAADFDGKNIMVDDYPKNIEAAKKTGFYTVLVGEGTSDYADVQIDDVHGIETAAKEIKNSF
ncbi:MAG: pyrimidine 5'-nucleotidase [Epsilonproteobacteria bacterium]|nr:pyrimidine 5'-nucleotidase [Campylobacterota bacterium]